MTNITVYPHLWPEPICDRPPTADDGDHEGLVQYLNHEGRWASGSWELVASNFGRCPWLHCPQWRIDWSDKRRLIRVDLLVPVGPDPTNAARQAPAKAAIPPPKRNRLHPATTTYGVAYARSLLLPMPNSPPPRLPSGRKINPADPAHVSITVRLPVALYEQLTAVARQEQRSRNFIAVRLLSLMLQGAAVIEQIVSSD